MGDAQTSSMYIGLSQKSNGIPFDIEQGTEGVHNEGPIARLSMGKKSWDLPKLQPVGEKVTMPQLRTRIE